MPPPEPKEAQMSQSEYNAVEELNRKLKEKVKALEMQKEAQDREIAQLKALNLAIEVMTHQNKLWKNSWPRIKIPGVRTNHGRDSVIDRAHGEGFWS